MSVDDYVLKNKELFLKSLDYLDYSYNKVKSLNTDTKDLEELETWEGFMARFARSVDIFLSKYLRSRVMFEEPGFRGSLRDFLNKAEKIGIIDDKEKWIAIKEIRNMQAHEYAEENLGSFFAAALQEVSIILDLKNKL